MGRLAVGLGMNATVFTAMHAILFRGWRAQAKSITGLAAVADLRVSVNDETGLPDSYTATRISVSGFRLLGLKPVLGRDFAERDEEPGAPPVAMLSHGFWERRYGKDPEIVGRTIWIDRRPTTVIGVMASGVSFPQKQDRWVPLAPSAELQKREPRRLWFAFGRLREGATIAGAMAEMETIGNRLASEYPLTNRGFPAVVQTFHEFFIGPNAARIYVSLWGRVGFVLLIACANPANPMLARSIGRCREVSLRIALGAGRWRIVRQLLAESTMLAAMGGCWDGGWRD